MRASRTILAAMVLGVLLAFAGCSQNTGAPAESPEAETEIPRTLERPKDTFTIIPSYSESRFREIYLAGGCFWGVEAYLDAITGVEHTNVGYANGDEDQTNYELLKETGHAETVYVAYDPEVLPLEELLLYFYAIIDPTVENRQANDIGTQYRTGIYYVREEDRAVIEAVTAKVQEQVDGPIVTEIEPLRNYIYAEEYHQTYLYKNPDGYCHVDLRNIPRAKPVILAENYPRPTPEAIREKLTDLQFDITQRNGTEPAYENAYWDLEAAGMYVDIVTGEPLFLSLHKYDAGSGWPSFTRPVDWNVLLYRVDDSQGLTRVEVRSRSGDTHLGHIFPDGPKEEGGLRYCINSGALDFIPLEALTARGYGAYLPFFGEEAAP